MNSTIEHLRALLACPVCKDPLRQNGLELACGTCNSVFAERRGALSFIARNMYGSDAEHAAALKIIDYWGHGWEKRLTDDQHAGMFTREGPELVKFAQACLERHRVNQSIMIDATEAAGFAGSTFLNIGCGSGSEALVLGNCGAKTIAIDITSEAAAAGNLLLQRLGGAGIGVQADARFLPIRSASVDGVYSSGVLHHSPNIAQSISEVHRVLRPGGKAYVMLYATWSILFLQPRLVGFLRGNFSRSSQERVMSENTETDWRTEKRLNPMTQTFTKREVSALFAGFSKVSVQKRVFSFRQIRILGRVLEIMRLVSVLDRSLRFMNPVFGACLFIEAEK